MLKFKNSKISKIELFNSIIEDLNNWKVIHQIKFDLNKSDLKKWINSKVEQMDFDNFESVESLNKWIKQLKKNSKNIIIIIDFVNSWEPVDLNNFVVQLEDFEDFEDYEHYNFEFVNFFVNGPVELIDLIDKYQRTRQLKHFNNVVEFYDFKKIIVSTLNEQNEQINFNNDYNDLYKIYIDVLKNKQFDYFENLLNLGVAGLDDFTTFLKWYLNKNINKYNNLKMLLFNSFIISLLLIIYNSKQHN